MNSTLRIANLKKQSPNSMNSGIEFESRKTKKNKPRNGFSSIRHAAHCIGTSQQRTHQQKRAHALVAMVREVLTKRGNGKHDVDITRHITTYSDIELCRNMSDRSLTFSRQQVSSSTQDTREMSSALPPVASMTNVVNFRSFCHYTVADSNQRSEEKPRAIKRGALFRSANVHLVRFTNRYFDISCIHYTCILNISVISNPRMFSFCIWCIVRLLMR
jgi:hypothetical protein